MKNAWKKYLDRAESSDDEMAHEYIYPVTDKATDKKLQKQDPEKSTREKSIISLLLDRYWEVAIDFGFGTGIHFQLFDQQVSIIDSGNSLYSKLPPSSSILYIIQYSSLYS